MTHSALPQPGAPLEHYVSDAPFDPYSIEKMTPEQERVFRASQLRLIWWKFRRHRLAVVSAIFLLLLYFVIVVVEVLAPYNLHTRNVDFIHAPPQRVRLFHDGNFVGPFVYGRDMTLDMNTLKRNYADNTNKVEKLRFFCSGDKYKFWGMFEASFHVVCPAEGGQFFLMGSDRLAATSSPASSMAPAFR